MKALLTFILAALCSAQQVDWTNNQFALAANRADAINIGGTIYVPQGSNNQQLIPGCSNPFCSGGNNNGLSQILNLSGMTGLGGYNSGGIQLPGKLGQILGILQIASTILNMVQTMFGGQQIAQTTNINNGINTAQPNNTGLPSNTGLPNTFGSNNSMAGTAPAQLLAQRALGLSANDAAGPGYCAMGVRLTLESLGIPAPSGLATAREWDPWLQSSSSFNKIPVSSPSQAPLGSIVVFNTGESGHIAIVGQDAAGNRVYVSDKGRYNYEDTRSGFTGYAYVPNTFK